MKVEDKVMDLAKRRGFIWGPSPNIYHGGVSGFYDWGPLGKLLKNKIEGIIRKGFVSNGFWEVECPTIMPKKVWEASGHLKEFVDPITNCTKCDSAFRVDNLIKEKYPKEKIEGLNFEKLKLILDKKKINCPSCNGGFGSVTAHNLMMKTEIGLNQEAYLRPETATTTYLLFPEYYRFFRTKMPFGVFQIGKAYRNEISPRQGVFRTREFTQAEGQLFIIKDSEKDFEKFDEISSEILPLIPFDKKISKIKIKDAVKKKILKKKTYAWTLGIAYNIVKDMGFPLNKIRIRQHNPNELAHYAEDAWDIEINTDRFGWFEICGVHDRKDYDLKRHGEFSKSKFSIGNETPGILEIAFGLERPTYCLLEEALREDEVMGEKRDWLCFPQGVAPIDVAIFPLMKKEGMSKLAKEIFDELDKEFVCTYDQSGSIGRRYRRMDEVGTTLCITVDHDSLKDKSATLREISSMKQIRVKIEKLRELISEILYEEKDFKKLK
jgi:glycyl-tRNA synthetase